MIRSTSGPKHALRLRLSRAALAGFTVVALAPTALADNASYTVQRGDSLYGIAKRLKVTEADLRAANHLADDSLIKVGQRLVIPQDGTAAPAVNATAAWTGTYAVLAGDNLFRIAQAHGVSQEALAQANGLALDGVLQIGQKLTVPVATSLKPRAVSGPVAKVAAPALAASSAAATPAATPAPEPALAAEPPAEAAALPASVRVLADRVVLRAGASVEAARLGGADPGAELKVVGKSGQWWQVLVPGTRQVAHVAGWVVKPVQPGEPTPAVQPATKVAADEVKADSEKPARAASLTATIAEDRVNLRSGPSTQSTRLSTLDGGTTITVLQNGADWVQVRVGDQMGWVAKELTSLVPRSETADEAMASSTSSAGGDRLVKLAKGYLGVPYARGGTSKRGVDCSGLVYAVAKECGIKLPRTSSGMWGNGTKVSRGNLQAGDVVFFRNTYREGISHVGLYVGDGKFIHAARTGRPVAVASLNDSYYKAHWAGAYRIVD